MGGKRSSTLRHAELVSASMALIDGRAQLFKAINAGEVAPSGVCRFDRLSFDPYSMLFGRIMDAETSSA
jgi:hypothetical protein